MAIGLIVTGAWIITGVLVMILRGPILGALYAMGSKLNRRVKMRQQAHSESLAEWLRESAQDKTGE